jgi:hypothetical protein
MFNSDLTANRPAAGIVGRIFIAIDAPYGIFRDTGTGWDQISSAGGGATIYTGDGTLTGTRTISSGGFQLVFNPQTTFFSSLIPSTSASSFAVLGSNTLTFAAGFSSSNIGNVYSANGAINAQIFSGDATFAQANLASAMVNVNKIDFSSGGHTITMTQSTAPGIRAMTGVQNQIQFTGSHNGRITHAAISQNLGFYRESGSTSTLTITNAYSLLINPLDDYGAGFTFTNRWGIYQAGASDKNYFAANSLFGTTTDTGQRLQVNGDTFLKGSGATSATSSLIIQDSAGTEIFRVRNDGVVKIGDGGVNNTVGNNALQINSGFAFWAIKNNLNLEFIHTNVSLTPLLTIGFYTTYTTGNTYNNLRLTRSFTHSTANNAAYNSINVNDTINQTGGANGITRGLYINPTLTAFADWRAIEISAGISILAPATTASATLRVPAGTAPTTPTDGDIWFDGTNLFMRIGGVTKTFTII